MKVAIVSCGIFHLNKWQDYVSVTNKLKQAYCDAHENIDYFWSNENMHEGRDPHFARFALLLYAFSKGYDWAVYMDCDAAPVNFRKDLSEWLATKPQDKAIIQSDVLGLNSGVMALPNTPRVVEWLMHLDSEEVYEKYKDAQWQDQDAIADSLKDEKWAGLAVEPELEFGFNHFETIYPWYARENLECPNRYKVGDFCLHIPGFNNTYRRTRFLQELESIENIVCPICGAIATEYVSVPFSKTFTGFADAAHMDAWGELGGRGCGYCRCTECGYIFAPAFLAIGRERLRELIYNGAYDEIHPSHADNALGEALFDSMRVPMSARGDRILDLGGWLPSFNEKARQDHFYVDSIDLFFAERLALPREDQRYTAVYMWNSLERCCAPRALFAYASDRMCNHAQMIVRTPVVDLNETCRAFAPERWPFLAPRCGIAGMHTSASLQILASSCGLAYKRNASNGMLSIFEKRFV